MTSGEYHKIIKYVRNVIEGTQWEGHVFAVGGCCRDDLMELPINDIDLAVDLPDGGVRFAEWLHKRDLLAARPVIFARFGTAKLRLKEFRAHEIELVQTRAEKYTDKNSRNPETAFGSIYDDAMRRDLTINALYYDVSHAKLIDLTGTSLHDIQHKIIRTPSDPGEVFDDDPVRILRCIRFAAKYGWPITSATWEGLVDNVKRLAIVTPERLFAELDKMLTGPRPSEALRMLAESGALAVILPELEATRALGQNKYHFGTVWEHTLKVVENTPPQSPLRWSALLHDIGKISTRSVDADGNVHFYRHERCAPMITAILARLRARPDFIRKVATLAECHMLTKSWGDQPGKEKIGSIRKLQRRMGSQHRFDELMTLIHADNISHASDYCLPQQVKHIRKLVAADRAAGVDIFNYKLPIPLRKIMKICGVKSPDNAEVREYEKKLLKIACGNPYITRQQCESLVLQWHDSNKPTCK